MTETSAATVPSPTASVGYAGAFPGPRVAGLCMIVAPLLAAAGTAMGIPIYRASGVAFARAIAQHPVQTQVALNITVAGIVLFLLAVAGVAQCIAAIRPALGRVAGVVAMIGLVGPIWFEGIYWSTTQSLGDDPTTLGTLMDRAQIVPRTIMNVSGPALVVGFVLLAVGVAVTGLTGRIRGALLGAACLMPVGFITGHLAIATAGFGCAAVTLVPWGLRLLRGSAPRTGE